MALALDVCYLLFPQVHCGCDYGRLYCGARPGVDLHQGLESGRGEDGAGLAHREHVHAHAAVANVSCWRAFSTLPSQPASFR